MASRSGDQFVGVTEQEMFEMDNVPPEDTGLPRRIWICVNPRGEPGRPRLRVEGTDQEVYAVSIDEPVEFLGHRAPGWSAAEFEDLQRFVTLNREVLMLHWDDRLNSLVALNRIRPIS
jgi:hypothetical protein